MNGPFTSPHSSLEMPAPPPAPRTVTDEEMNFVKTCLQRWRSEIEQDIQGWCPELVGYLLPVFPGYWKPGTLGICSLIAAQRLVAVTSAVTLPCGLGPVELFLLRTSTNCIVAIMGPFAEMKQCMFLLALLSCSCPVSLRQGLRTDLSSHGPYTSVLLHI